MLGAPIMAYIQKELDAYFFMKITKEKRQVSVLYISTLLGVLLGVLSSIINTRFLDTSSYGDVRYVQNIINFISSLLLFGYFLSGSRLLALSNNESYSRRIRGGLVIILCIAGGVLMLSCFICYLIHINSSPIVAQLFLISIPVCLSPLLSNFINTTAQGDNHIGRLSLARLLPLAVYIPMAYCVFILTGASSTKMMILQFGLQTIILFLIIYSTKPVFINLKPIFKELNEENRQYGFQLYMGSLVMVATNYIAGITISLVNHDNSEVGFYTLALTVTSPLATLPAIIGTTFFKKFATEDRIPPRIMKFSLILTMLSCLAFIIVIKPIVMYIYSERYAPVGTYAMWLAVGFSIHGFGDMINRYLGSHGQGKSIRNSSIYNGLFKVFGYTVLVYYMNTAGALLTNVLCSVIYCGCIFYYYVKFVNKNGVD